MRNKNLTISLYDNHDAFDFHIVKFPFLSSYNTSPPVYSVSKPQAIRFAGFCSGYSDFLYWQRASVTRYLSQGYKSDHLSNKFNNFFEISWEIQ